MAVHLEMELEATRLLNQNTRLTEKGPTIHASEEPIKQLLELLGDERRDANEEIKKHFFLHRVAECEVNDYADVKDSLVFRIDISTLSVKDGEGKTALHTAAEKDNFEFCEVLIDACKEISRKANENNGSVSCSSNKNDIYEQCKNLIGERCIDNLTTVHLACKKGNPKILDLLLENGGDPFAVTSDKYTPLHYAAQSGSEECVKLLLTKILPSAIENYLNMQTQDDKTALMFAAKQGFIIICNKLAKSDLNLRSKDGKTALHYAATKGIHIVKYFFATVENAAYTEEEKKDKIPLHNKDFLCECLYSSIQGGSSKCFAHFLKNALKTKLTREHVEKLVNFSVNKHSLKCLQHMAKRKEFHKYLREFRDENDNSLLHLAIKQQKFIIAKLLLETVHFDKLVKNRNRDSALHVLADKPCEVPTSDEDRQYVIDELLWNARELIKSTNTEGKTPLQVAASSGNAEMIKHLLDKEDDTFPCVDEQAKDNKTAVHCAAEKGHAECLKLLLDKIPTLDVEFSRNIEHPLHFAASNGHYECCELLLTHKLGEKNYKKGLFSNDAGKLYPVDKAYKSGSVEIFRFLLSKMERNACSEGDEKEFSVRLHGYFKECLKKLSQEGRENTRPRVKDKKAFNIGILEAIIESSWCEVVLNGRFCSTHHKLLRDPAYTGSETLPDDAVPCNSLALLIKKFPDLATKALDRHIRSDGNVERHNYTPFECNYYRIRESKLVTPFENELPPLADDQRESQSSETTSPKGCSSCGVARIWAFLGLETSNDAKTNNSSLRAHYNEFQGKSWYEGHPLHEALDGRHAGVLTHKLTKSWLKQKVYTRLLLYCYLFLDFVTAVFVSILQAAFWNTDHLQKAFSGVTREQIAGVCKSDAYYNNTVQALTGDVRTISNSDQRCATWGNGSGYEAVAEGSAAWNRSMCATFHLEQHSSTVVFFEAVVAILILFHVVAEIFLSRNSFTLLDLHRVSRIVRIIFMFAFLFGFGACDFELGTRQEVVWEFGVVAVLVTCMHFVVTLNKVPTFAGFLPVTPKLLTLYLLAIVPLVFFLLAFAVAFHFLLAENASFGSVLSSFVKTITLTLGDLEYDSTFQNVQSPLYYPILSNVIFVLFIITMGGIVWNLVNKSEKTIYKELGEDDDTYRAAAQLHINMLIEEYIPCLRRKQACAFYRYNVKRKHLF